MSVPYKLYTLPPLCMNCKHFLHPKATHMKVDLTQGKCMRYAKINVIHGKLEHLYADVAREYFCINAK